MQTIKALREFEYQSKKYKQNHVYSVHENAAEYLLYRGLVVFANQESPNVLEGETKELKKETVKKPFPVSKRK